MKKSGVEKTGVYQRFKGKAITFGFLIIFFLALFLRLYRLKDYQFFTYDQARDYLIISKIVKEGKFTLVGPTVLAPGVYLPPFYYYSLIPFLVLFNFRILGPDVYTAFFGVLSVIAIYFVAKEFFGKTVGLFLGLITAVNPYLVHLSRHTWNPNTIYFFSLIFIFSCWKMVKKKSFLWVLASFFCLGWALNLHYTILVFVPTFFIILASFLKKFGLDKRIFFGILIFLLFLLPISFFEVRHNFSNSRNILSLIFKIENNLRVNKRNSEFKSFFFDWIKLPYFLVFGAGQEENLTVNPFKIVLFDQTGERGNILLFLSSALFILTYVLLFRDLKNNQEVAKFLFLFLVTGFLVRFIFPSNSFYFYHYTFLFPLIFLLVGYLLKKVWGKDITRKFSAVLLGLFFIVLPVTRLNLKKEIRNEEFFLPSCRVIDGNFVQGEVVVAANLADQQRWDHNALEYRYFLGTYFGRHLLGWEEIDYKKAQYLFLIDETGNLIDPIKELHGMEMESFSPQKVIRLLKIADGKKVFLLSK